jgi:hypothetical protein
MICWPGHNLGLQKVFAMNKATRILAVTGMSLLAGLTFGATPALAGSSSVATNTTVEQMTPQAGHDEGHYRSFRDCERAGRWGVWQDDWEHYRCNRDWRGYELYVWGGDHDDHGGHGDHGDQDDHGDHDGHGHGDHDGDHDGHGDDGHQRGGGKA